MAAAWASGKDGKLKLLELFCRNGENEAAVESTLQARKSATRTLSRKRALMSSHDMREAKFPESGTQGDGLSKVNTQGHALVHKWWLLKVQNCGRRGQGWWCCRSRLHGTLIPGACMQLFLVLCICNLFLQGPGILELTKYWVIVETADFEQNEMSTTTTSTMQVVAFACYICWPVHVSGLSLIL
jgi:hypothetical protein